MNEQARIGADPANPWMLTASGLKLYFLDPKPEAINLLDVSHHLGNLCRFTGAMHQFYSIAQHSVLVAQLVKVALDDEGVDRDSVEYWDQILAALFHDGEEAYVNDLSSPLKMAIRGKYEWIATAIRRILFENYGVDWQYYNKTVKDADNIAILIERFHFMPQHSDWPGDPDLANQYDKPAFMDPRQATKLFEDTCRYALLMRKACRVEAASGGR